jgi:hypothetical protein
MTRIIARPAVSDHERKRADERSERPKPRSEAVERFDE